MSTPDETWSHPLIRTLDRPMSRRIFTLGTAGLLGVAGARPGLRLVAAQEASPEASPAMEVSGQQDAVALLNAAAKALADLKTFAFDLETTRGSSTVLEGLNLKKIEGVVRRPMDVEAKLTVGVPFGDLTITAIGVNGSYWVQDPLSNGKWMSLGRDPQVQSLINPDALILLAVRLVHDAKITGKEKVDGVETTVVEGTVDFAGAASSVMGSSRNVSSVLAPGAKDITFWIDDQNRIVEVEIQGPLLASESQDVVRVLTLYDFNKPVEIATPPAGGQ